ncbi:MAG: hypothetical protein QMC93_01840 [Patescibacteria group bacterium]|nr:hypothetical protein [Patescibacteria group bacterium]
MKFLFPSTLKLSFPFYTTIILVLLPEPLRFIGFPSSIVGPARQIIYALLLLLILLYKPKGFSGKVELE